MSQFSRRVFLSSSMLGTQAWLAACGGGAAGASTISISEAGGGAAPTAGPPASLPQPPTPTSAMPPAPMPGGAPVAAPATWTVGPALALTAGTESNIDLNDTLPADVRRGGIFSVDASGAALPLGVTLATSGLLSVAAMATAGIANGVVFAYAVE